jgi:hypothetical protein
MLESNFEEPWNLPTAAGSLGVNIGDMMMMIVGVQSDLPHWQHQALPVQDLWTPVSACVVVRIT